MLPSFDPISLTRPGMCRGFIKAKCCLRQEIIDKMFMKNVQGLVTVSKQNICTDKLIHRDQNYISDSILHCSQSASCFGFFVKPSLGFMKEPKHVACW